jgi:hypothetical protein
MKTEDMVLNGYCGTQSRTNRQLIGTVRGTEGTPSRSLVHSSWDTLYMYINTYKVCSGQDLEVERFAVVITTLNYERSAVYDLYYDIHPRYDSIRWTTFINFPFICYSKSSISSGSRKLSPQLNDQGCATVLRDQGYNTLQRAVTDEYGTMTQLRLGREKTKEIGANLAPAPLHKSLVN